MRQTLFFYPLTLILLLFAFSTVYGQAPLNDSCINAHLVNLPNGGFDIGKHVTDSFDIDSATVEIGEYFHTSQVTSGNDKKSIWFKFYIPARRGLDIELKQPGTAIATNDVGFTTYFSESCLPTAVDANNAKITTLNQFGSSFNPCVEPGWYAVQISAKNRAQGKIYLEITTSFPYTHSGVVDAEYDAQDSAYQFGNGIVGVNHYITSYRDFELGCYTINDSTEILDDIGTNANDYNQSAWFTVQAQRDADLVAFKLSHRTGGCSTTDTVGFRLFEGDCKDTLGLTLLDSGVYHWGTGGACYSSCGDIALFKSCLFDSGKVYSVQWLFHKDLTKTMRFRIQNWTSRYDSGYTQPTIAGSDDIGVVSGSVSSYYGFSCRNYIGDNSCSSNTMPSGGITSSVSGNQFNYNLVQWKRFEIAENSKLTIRTATNIWNSSAFNTQQIFRLYKDTATTNCGNVDSANLILEGRGNATYTELCLEPGNYIIQLLGTDSNWNYSSYSCSGPMHLGKDFYLSLTQSPLPEINRFALFNKGEADTINSFDSWNNYSYVYGDYDTVACNDALRPEVLTDTTLRKAMYRVFDIGDFDNDGVADSGLLHIGGLLTSYDWRTRKYYSNHQLYKGDALSLRDNQSVSTFPDTLTGLTSYKRDFSRDNDGSVCITPGRYTLASFFSEELISSRERPYFYFYKSKAKFNTPAKAEVMDTVDQFTTFYGEKDTFNCLQNSDTIDGFALNNRNSYHVFYLDSSGVMTVGMASWYNRVYYGYRVSVFKGDIRNGKSGLKMFNSNGTNWYLGQTFTNNDCYPVQPGWYTVVVSHNYDIAYDDTLVRAGSNHFSHIYNQHGIYVTLRKPTTVPPKFYRPFLACSIDSLVNNNKSLSYDANYCTTPHMKQNLARFTFPQEVLECDLDTPVNYIDKSVLCDTNTTDITYYTFNLEKDASVKMYANYSGGSWKMKLYNLDVKKDSALLSSSTPVQDCNYNPNYVEFCHLKAGVYSAIYFCRRTKGQRSTVQPTIFIDSIVRSRFDFISNAYDFGFIPGDSVLRDGKIGDVHPTNDSLPPSHDVIGCYTGAPWSDLYFTGCYQDVNPLIYSVDTNESLYPYDSLYLNQGGQRYNTYSNYHNKRTLWYTFATRGNGTIRVKLNGLSAKYRSHPTNDLRVAIYKTDEDGTLSYDSLKSLGKIDSSYADGLTWVFGNNEWYRCRYSQSIDKSYEYTVCEPSEVRRFYVQVDLNSYHLRGSSNFNRNIWLQVSYDSISDNTPNTKFDYISKADTIVLNPTSGVAYIGEKDYFKTATYDTTDYGKTYPWSSCSDPNVAKTLWYKFEVDSTGYVYYNFKYTDLSSSPLERLQNSETNIRLFKVTDQTDTVNGIQFIPSSYAGYTLIQSARYSCVSPGTYYLQINGCNWADCRDYAFPQIYFDFHDADFCESAKTLELDTLEKETGRVLVNCHTIGTDFGEDGTNMGCLDGPNGFKTSWYKIDYTDTTKVDLEFKLAEYTNAKASDIKYRTYYGNCISLTPGPCNNNALTSFVLDCVRKGTYYVQVTSPSSATGELELSVEAKENTDTTCVPIDIFQPNAAFSYRTSCPENIVEFRNTSTRGDSIRYFWDLGYNGWTDTTINPVVIYPPDSKENSYTVKLVVTNVTRGSKDSITLPVLVPFAPEVSILSNDTIICEGDSVELEAYISHGDGFWSTGDSSTKTTVNSTGVYYFDMQDKPQLLSNASFEKSSYSDWITSAGLSIYRTQSYYPIDSSYCIYSSLASAATTGVFEFSQEVDVSYDSLLIDSGISQNSFVGYVRGHSYSGYLDEGQIVLEYLSDNNTLLGVYSSGWENYKDNWEIINHVQTTPKNTRKIKVRVQMNKQHVRNQYPYIFWDKFTLKMRSSCSYKDSILVIVRRNPKLQLPSDTTVCYGDSLDLSPVINYEGSFVAQDSFNDVRIRDLYGTADDTLYQNWLFLNNSRYRSGQVNWSDSSLLLTDTFSVSFDMFMEDRSGYTSYYTGFYFGQTGAPNGNRSSGTGYRVSFQEYYNSGRLYIYWHNTVLFWTTIDYLADSKWHNVRISYYNQRFEIYLNGKRIVTYTDPNARTQGGYNYGIIGGQTDYYYTLHQLRNFSLSKESFVEVVIPSTGTPYSYLWSDGSTNPNPRIFGSDTLVGQITDALGCISNYDTIVIEQVRQYDSLLSDEPVDVCDRLDSFLLDNPYTGAYYFGNSHVDSSGNINMTTVPFGQSQVFYAYRDTFNCLLQDTATFEVDSLPTITIDSVGPFCKNDSIIQLTVNSTDGYFYGGVYIDSVGRFDPSLALSQFNWVYYETFGEDCKGKDSIQIRVDSLPDASITQAGPYCENVGMQLLTGAVNTTGSFTASSYLSTTGDFDPSVAMAGTHKVYYTFTDGNGCTNTDSTDVVVDSIPNASITAAGPFCANAGVQSLSGAINTGGTFTVSPYVTSTGDFDPSVAMAGTHKVYYTFTDGNGCTNDDSTTIAVDSIPDASITPAGPFCENAGTQSILPQGNTGGWFTETSYLDSFGLFDPAIALTRSHLIYYTFLDGNGCRNTDSSVIRVDSLPDASITPSGPFCENGGLQTITPQTNTYGWFTETAYIDSFGVFDPAISLAGNHRIYYNLIDGNGCQTIDSTTIQIDTIPDASITPGGPFCENGGVQTILPQVNTGGWFTETSYLDSFGLFDPAIALTGNHLIYYTFQDGNGCSNLDSTTVQIDSIPDASIMPAGPLCENAGTQSILPQVNTGGWFRETTYLDSFGVFDPAVALTGSYTIYYNFIDANGCRNTDSTIIRVDSLPDASITPAGPFCENEGVQTITPQVNPGGWFTETTFLDSFGVFDPLVASVGTHTIYYNIVFSGGCSNLDSLSIRVDSIPDASIIPVGPVCENGGVQTIVPQTNNYGWFIETAYLDSFGVFDPAIASTGSHRIYYNLIDGNGCQTLDSTTVQIDSIPDASITPAGPFCENAGVQTILPQVNAGGWFTETTYLDSFGVFDPATALPGNHKIFYTFIDGNNCSNSDSSILEVTPVDIVTISSVPDICKNANPIQLTSTPTGGAYTAESYVTTLGEFNPLLATLGQNRIIYTYTNTFGCTDADTIFIVALDTPTNTLTILPDEGCEMLTFTLSTEAINNVEWSIGNNIVSNDYTYTDSLAHGKYDVQLRVTNTEGCEITRVGELEVFENPDANFSYSPQDIYISNPEVFFQDASIGNVIGWDWDLGDGNSSSNQSPNHTYDGAGEYTVILFIEDDNGCIDSTSQQVVVKDELLLFIPNAFSPNGDGLNDVFNIAGLGIENVQMQIFNRWGEKLLDQTEFKGWDGVYKGEPVQIGVYVYMATIIDNRGRKTFKKGEIHLVR